MPTTVATERTALRAPTVDDARRAAAVLEAAGARKVILFGSVARNEQTVDSDIDLAAIFDDLDYVRRDDLRSRLCIDLQRAAGFDVSLHVTDFPEWNGRLANVPTCLDASIATHGIALVDLQPTLPERRSKESPAAMTREDEAIRRLNDVRNDLNAAVKLREGESEEPTDGGPATGQLVDLLANERLKQLGQLHLAIEAALKALLAQRGTEPPRSHSTDELERLLPEPDRSAVAAIRGDLDHHQIERWHVESNYDGLSAYEVEELRQFVQLVARVAIDLAAYATDSFENEFGPLAARPLIRQFSGQLRDLLGISDAGQ